jgi:hypothetical protein
MEAEICIVCGWYMTPDGKRIGPVCSDTPTQEVLRNKTPVCRECEERTGIRRE